MLWLLIVGLVMLWLIGLVVSFTLNGLIHLLLLVALGVLVYNLLTDRRTV